MKFFGRLFGEGKVKPTAVSGNFPPITKQYLHEKFGDYSKKPTPGKGGKIFDEAVRAWNAFDYDKAFDLLSKAVAAGLKGPERSTVHSLLGQIHIQWHQLDRAVDEFLKCLEIPDRVSSMTWQSAMHLYYIYSELGRDSEAKSVLSIVEKANEGQRWVHAAEAERETRDLTKHYVQK